VVSGQFFKLPMLWAAIFTAAGLTLLLLGLVTLAERLLWRWTGTAKEL
jgi:NitT/TauT family transport system permease protein